MAATVSCVMQGTWDACLYRGENSCGRGCWLSQFPHFLVAIAKEPHIWHIYAVVPEIFFEFLIWRYDIINFGSDMLLQNVLNAISAEYLAHRVYAESSHFCKKSPQFLASILNFFVKHKSTFTQKHCNIQ